MGCRTRGSGVMGCPARPAVSSRAGRSASHSSPPDPHQAHMWTIELFDASQVRGDGSLMTPRPGQQGWNRA